MSTRSSDFILNVLNHLIKSIFHFDYSITTPQLASLLFYIYYIITLRYPQNIYYLYAPRIIPIFFIYYLIT